MPEEEQNFSAAMRVARRSVWEQAKAAGIQNDETPPPAPTGKETGLNDDPRIARLEGIVRDLAGRLDDLEDDYPESEIGNGVGGAASGAWSGFVWYLGDLKWDFSKVDADPDGEALEGGLGAALEGIYLVIELETGDFQWADSVSGIEGVSASTHSLFPVCVRSGSGTEEDPYTYALSSNRVVGDIRIEAVPYLPVAEAEET